MKSFTAKILLLVFIISAIMPAINVAVVYAQHNKILPYNTNSIGIRPSVNEFLVTGGFSYSPNTPANLAPGQEIPDGNIHLNLDTTNLLTQGPRTFYYLLDQNTKIEFVVTAPSSNLPNSLYEAEYRVYNWQGTRWELLSVDPDSILVHSGTTNSFIPATEAMSTLGDDNPSHRITLGSSGVVFGFARNEGFSFIHNGRTVHFRMDFNGNSIRFVTDGLTNGVIYNFYAKDRVSSGHTAVFTGFDINNIGTIPFTEGRTENIDNNTDINFRNDIVPVDINGGEETATPEVGMAVRFDEPMTLWINDDNEPNNTPVSFINTNIVEYNIPVTIRMNDNRSSQDYIQIELGDIVELTTNKSSLNIQAGSAVTQPSDSSWAKVIREGDSNTPNRIEVRLRGLLPGTLFSNFRLDANVSINNTFVTSRAARLTNLGTAFTFPSYRFVYQDGQFQVELDTFAGFAGVYILTMNSQPDGSGGELRRMRFESGEGTVLIPLPETIGVGLSSTYQILFAPNETIQSSFGIPLRTMIYSERSNYTTDPSHIQVGTPRDFQIIEYNLKPLSIYEDPSLWGTEGILSMTLRWALGNAQSIRSLVEASGSVNINYGINRGLRPEANLGSRFANINITIENVRGELQATYQVTHLGENGEVIGNIGNGTFIIEEDDNGFAYIQVELDDIPASRSNLTAPVESENSETNFLYPRIYHINIELLAERGGLSTFESITLNDLLRPNVPPVQNFNIVQNSVTTSSFGLNWNISAREVLEFMENSWRDKEKLGEELELSVNLYISQSESLMRDLALLETKEERRTFSSDFSAENLQDGNSIIFNDDPLLALRTDNVVLIENINIGDYASFILNLQNFPYTLGVEGVDENQRYYVYVTLVSTYKEGGGIDQHESILSELLGLTTMGKPDIPDDTDRIPAPPTVSIKDVGLDTATVYWPYVELHAQDSNISVHYEVVRITNKQMDSRFLNTSQNITDFIRTLTEDMPNTELEFLQTPYDETGSLEIFNGSTFIPVNPSQFQLVFEQAQIEIIDKTLSSNQIYFYYVRTVRTVDTENGTHVAHSEWAVQTATTSTLSPPINLDIDLTFNNYDPKTEFMIRFDAPIINLDNLGEEVVFEYSIREEDGEFSNPVRMDSQLLRNSASQSLVADHINFIYRISGLNPNTGYTIRVRMVNVETGDTSAWSNTATTRTELDQNIIDQENDMGSWEDYYKQELENLLRNPYWVLEDTNRIFRVVYRPSMYDSLLLKSTGSQIVLAQSEKGANTHVYYIPSSIFLGANSQEKGFTIIIGDVEIIIPPRALDHNTNEHIIRINNDLRNINNNIKDYYIRIAVENRSHTNNVNGNSPLSDQIEISYEIVGSEMTASEWDAKIQEMHIQEIEQQSKSSYIRNWILDSLRRGRPFDEMVRRILEWVEETRLSLIRQTNTSFNRERAFARRIHELDLSMIIVYRNNSQGTIVNGYRWVGSGWQSITTSDFGDFKGIRSNLLGTFIFAGRTVSVPGLSDTQNGGVAFSIITRYALDEVLGQRGSINLEAVATRNMFVKSASRIGGMQQGGNPVQFLTSKGYFVPAGNLNGSIAIQEAIYIMMSVYEIKTNTSLETIVIRNHGAISNIEGIDPRYLPSIRAGFEIGLYTDASFQPNSNITIREMLEMLTLLDSKVSL